MKLVFNVHLSMFPWVEDETFLVCFFFFVFSFLVVQGLFFQSTFMEEAINEITIDLYGMIM